MSNLKLGTVLLQTGAVIPESVWIEKETYSPGWEEVTNVSGDDLDRQLRRENWSFFFIGGAIQGTSWGSWSGAAIRCAAIRTLNKTEVTKFNGFEITGIYSKRFLGIRYVRVIGHARHLQPGPVLQNLAERTRQASPSSAISAAAPLPAPALAG
jgi:hypothetical protein